jgi:hypothetical protein
MLAVTAVLPVRDYSLALKDWLHRCYSTSFSHGSQLVESWKVADNVSRSCRVLDQLVDVGWIKPFEYATPSFEMTFFGVGGRPPGVKSKGKWRASHTYACEFGFEPNYDNADFMDWIRQ